MDFDESPEESAFRGKARAWLEENAVPRGAPGDFSTASFEDRDLPPAERERFEAEHAAKCRAWQATLREGGWAGITWPVEHGGRGGSPVEEMIFAEEHAQFGVTTDVVSVGVAMVGPTIIAHGTEVQKQRYLDPILRGEEAWCQLFSEPGAGSDLAGLSTRAVADGDGWVVTGQKVWTSYGAQTDFGILLARTDIDVPKHRGITCLLLDMRAPGVEVRPLRQMNGHAHFAEVFLTDVPVAAGSVLGEVGGGWAVAMTTLAHERALMGSGLMASTSALLEEAHNAGRAGDPVVRQALAAAYTREQILRFLGFRLRTAISQGRAPGSEANCMKLAMGWHVKRTSELAVELQGPTGMLGGQDAPRSSYWQQRMLTAPSLRIAGGSDEVQHNVIGERVLGLPPDIRVDKKVPFRELADLASRARSET